MAKRHVMTPARRAALRKAQLASAKKRRRRQVAGGAVGLGLTAVYLNGRYGNGGYTRRKNAKAASKAKAMPHKPGRGPAGHGPSAFRPKPVQLALPEGKTTKANRNRPKAYTGKSPLRAMFHASNRYVMPGQIGVKNLNGRKLPQSRFPQKRNNQKRRIFVGSGDFNGTVRMKYRDRTKLDVLRRKQYKGMSNSQKKLRRIGTIKGSM